MLFTCVPAAVQVFTCVAGLVVKAVQTVTGAVVHTLAGLREVARALRRLGHKSRYVTRDIDFSLPLL